MKIICPLCNKEVEVEIVDGEVIIINHEDVEIAEGLEIKGIEFG